MLRKPSAVVFDLGKVLVDFDYGLVVNRVAARSRMGVKELQRLVTEPTLLYAFERGELTSEQFYAAIARETGFQGDYPEFARYFADIFTEIPAMTALHRELRKRGVPTFIFSNTNDLAVDHIRRHFRFFADFDGYVLSYEHGWMKPDAPLYEAVEKVTGRSGADLFYLDDRPENVATALDRGWHALVHEDPAASRQRVRETGLLD